MGKIIRRILTIIPAVALQSLWLLLLMKWLTPYAPIIVSLLDVYKRQGISYGLCLLIAVQPYQYKF